MKRNDTHDLDQEIFEMTMSMITSEHYTASRTRGTDKRNIRKLAKQKRKLGQKRVIR